MLRNMELASSLLGLARLKFRDYETQTVNPLLVEEALAQGWLVDKKLKKLVRLRRPKPHWLLLEYQVWTMLYRMGFSYLPSEEGAVLEISSKTDGAATETKIDAVAIDQEIALAIECKSSEKPMKRPSFQEELGKLSLLREPFANTVNRQIEAPFKRTVALVMVTANAILSDRDRDRAKEANIALLDESDLTYYEELVAQLGVAARYQFLADLLPRKPIPGLKLRVPAIKAKMGGYATYTFSIPPAYLLKIGFVSHRAKGKASDIDAYQRMIRKSRLKSLHEYIDQRGVFPTNIVISLDRKPTFQRQAQEGNQEAGIMGWLELRPSYKSAWIIDGQHRLYAYSGHDRAAKDRLSVLAFEDLPASKQAQLFIDIKSTSMRSKRASSSPFCKSSLRSCTGVLMTL